MITALIVAAGKGIRMGGGLRKQFLPLGDHPVLFHTIKAFSDCDVIEKIVVVVPEEEKTYCREHILSRLASHPPVVLTGGGPRRQDSVYNGLELLDENPGDIVLIHDGVRPFVSHGLIKACVEGARMHRACIPATASMDTLKEVDRQAKVLRTVSRESIVMAQTPQAFELRLIKCAHEKARRFGWEATDDAFLVERMGGIVHLTEGERANIKITTPLDLKWVEFLLSQE